MNAVRYVNNVKVAGKFPITKTDSQATIQIFKELRSRVSASHGETEPKEDISGGHKLAPFFHLG